MEASTTIKNQKSSIEIEPSFEQGLNNNRFNLNLDSKIESKNKLIDKEKVEKFFFSKKLFEKSNIDEIYDLLELMNHPVTIDVNKINKKDYYYSNNEKRALSIGKKINISNNKKQHFKECQEILHKLQMPIIAKNDDKIPFKPLLKPKKISLVGKVIVDISNIKKSTSENKNENENNNNHFYEGNN